MSVEPGLLRRVLDELQRSEPVLARAGWTFAAILVALGVLWAVDDRQVLGINVWIKPAKFVASFVIFTWTMAWLLPRVRAGRALRGTVAWGIVAVLAIELVCIAGQSARGTRSHFNETTPFDAAVFQLMGIAIAVNTVLVALVLWQCRRPLLGVSPTLAWGARLGLALFIAGSLQAIVMLVNGAHAVGAPDGGPGLPFVNWSTNAGDLRIAHFLGLHGLQAMLVGAAAIDRWLSSWSEPRRLGVLVAAGATYTGVAALTLVGALRGVPLVGPW